MSAAPRPYIQPSRMTGSYGGELHMSVGPGGTTSMCAFMISERPVVVFGRCVPTTTQAFS